MRCIDFRRRWQQLLDDRDEPQWDAELQDHAAECARCNSLLNSPLPFSQLEVTTDDQLPPDFALRTIKRFRVEQQRRWAILLAVSASIAAGVLGLARFPQPPTEAGPSLSVTARSFTSGNLADTRSRSLIAASPQTSSGKAVSMQKIAPMIPDEWASLVRTWFSQAAFAQHLRLEPVEELAESFEPLASSFQVALHVLRKSLPVGRSNSSFAPHPPEPMERPTGGDYHGKLHSFG